MLSSKINIHSLKRVCLLPKKRLLHGGMAEHQEKIQGPLNGIRVCDMSRVLAGPYCTMVLGDMGAEIVKVERPGYGDETRKFGPPFLSDESIYFMSINRNKKSICVDMRKDAGKDIIYELVKKSDIFIENFVPDKMCAMGFGYEKLHSLNSLLIYCSITGFGSRGPDRDKPGYDLVANAQGGMLHITGEKDGKPCRPGVALVDIVTGMYMNGAIISALYERSFTGKGKKLEASLLQSQVAMLSDVATSFLNANIETSCMGTSHPAIVPYQAFKTADKSIVVAAGNDRHFQNLCKAIGCSDLISDKRFKSNIERVKNRDALIEILSNRLNTNTQESWLKCFSEHGVPSGPINDIEAVFAMPQIKSLGLVQEISHPTAGLIKVPGPAVEFDGMRPNKPIHPPLLGEHTTEIMRNVLNADDELINMLLEEKVIVQSDFNSG